MVFGSRSKVKKAGFFNLFMSGDRLMKVPTFKYLGVILDSTLNYNVHNIASVVRSVLHKMTLLAKMKRYLKADVATHIYKTMLLPYIDYADVIHLNSDSGGVTKNLHEC